MDGDDPHTLNSANNLNNLNNLAAVLHAFGVTEQARDLYRQAWQCRRRTLGPTHPRTLDSGRKLDLVLEQLGQPSEAQLALDPNRDHR